MADFEEELGIGEVARHTGLSVHALRFYEREGLLISEHIGEHVDRARCGTIAALKLMKGLKVVAAQTVSLARH